MTAFQTLARRSLWDALEHWPDTEDVFQQKYKWEDSLIAMNADADPDPPACPAISILPAVEVYEWKLNRSQENLISYNVILWTTTHDVTDAEDLFAKVRDAIWACEHHPGVTWVKKATGEHPVRLTNITMKPVFLGQTKNIPAFKTTFTIQLRRLNDPLPALVT